ncbi:Flp pilus assembly protein CpaB [Rubellimicrobium arenae]|uniref:Flp pilus assembly protein CpaB n=1 Tax=Rubellimicrobium arenae TaxID=2817372 RepID=UPI001B3168F8|nr:Flp pilus assembly protein CpaB [Rubellimicrobium arenae]
MRSLFALVLLAGMCLAGIAIYMVRSQFEAQANQLAEMRLAAATAVPTVEIYAASRPLAYGEALTPADVRPIRYVEPFLPDGVFRTDKDLFPQGPDMPRHVLRPMEANEPVLTSKVTEPGQDTGITGRLDKGMRAFAISVNATTGVSGFLRPGDRVDVYWTGSIDDEGRGARQVTQLIESGLVLVAIDQSTDDTAREVGIASNVTVAVTPRQVAKLAQAQASGSLSLALVGRADSTAPAPIEIDQKALLDLQDPIAPGVPQEASPPQVCTVRTRRAGEVIDTPVACPGP